MRALHRFEGRRAPRRVVVGATAAAAGVLGFACILVPPPDLPDEPLHRPTIQHDSVFPPPDEPLTVLPTGGFLVPVELDSPSEGFCYEIFVDYDSIFNPLPVNRQSPCVQASDAPPNGGVVTIPFDLDSADLDPTLCHRIEFDVAHSFSAVHVPDTIGGDSVSWQYVGNSQGAGCPTFDASTFGDGGWSMPDGEGDGLLVVPESGAAL